MSFVRRKVLDDDELLEVHPFFEQVARREGFYSEALMKRIADDGTVRDIDEVPEEWRRVFVTAHDITPEWHIRMQAAFQEYDRQRRLQDGQLPQPRHGRRRREGLPARLQVGLQGRDHLPRRQPRGAGAQRRVGRARSAPHAIPAAGIAVTRPARPKLLTGETERMETGCGRLFVIMNDDEMGPREVFANMGKAGGCASSNTEALGRLISLCLKKGAAPGEIVKQLKGIRCHVPYGIGPNAVLSCADAIGKAVERRYTNGAVPQGAPEPQLSLVEVAQGACPDCGGSIEHEGGCVVCRLCGYSKCG